MTLLRLPYRPVGMLMQETTVATSTARTRDPAASIERILTSSGVTKGALYHHFKSKADLLHAVIDDAIRPMIAERWMKPLAGTDDPIRAMAESTRAIMMDATPEELRCGCPLNNLSEELAGADEEFRKHLDRVPHDWRAEIQAVFEWGQRAGNVRGDVDCAAIATRQAVLRVDPSIAINDIRTMESWVAERSSPACIRRCGRWGWIRRLLYAETEGGR